MSEPRVVGLRPWLPWPLSRWRWWTEPVPAERLAALRIGLALVLLLDIFTTYLPAASTLFGAGSYGDPDAFSPRRSWSWSDLEWPAAKEIPHRDWSWSVVGGTLDRQGVLTVLAVWTASAVGLLLGLATRLCAVTAWLLSVSLITLNLTIHNAGDDVRTFLLFILMLCPSGAVWSLDRRIWRRGDAGPVQVWPWPLRLIFVQMTLIYFCNGMHKLAGETWQTGESLYYVMSDVVLARWPYSQLPVPPLLCQLLTWFVLGWEVGFPLFVALPWTRRLALIFGAAFHVGIGVSLELGMFTPYMLCLYLPLLPWERLAPAQAVVAPPIQAAAAPPDVPVPVPE